MAVSQVKTFQFKVCQSIPSPLIEGSLVPNSEWTFMEARHAFWPLSIVTTQPMSTADGALDCASLLALLGNGALNIHCEPKFCGGILALSFKELPLPCRLLEIKVLEEVRCQIAVIISNNIDVLM